MSLIHWLSDPLGLWSSVSLVQSLEGVLRHPGDNRSQIRELGQTLIDGGILDELISEKLEAFNSRYDRLSQQVRPRLCVCALVSLHLSPYVSVTPSMCLWVCLHVGLFNWGRSTFPNIAYCFRFVYFCSLMGLVSV